jgi:DNA primase
MSHATAVRFRLGVVPEESTNFPEMNGRLAIPSIGPKGNVYNLRFRSLDGSGAKYMGLAGYEARLFNTRAILEASEEIHITEGELDAIVLAQLGFSAVGVCGSNGWKQHHSRLFLGFSRVFVWGDGDDPGKKFAGEVVKSLPNARAVKLPVAADVNSVYSDQGEQGIRALLEELEAA